MKRILFFALILVFVCALLVGCYQGASPYDIRSLYDTADSESDGNTGSGAGYISSMDSSGGNSGSGSSSGIVGEWFLDLGTGDGAYELVVFDTDGYVRGYRVYSESDLESPIYACEYEYNPATNKGTLDNGDSIRVDGDTLTIAGKYSYQRGRGTLDNTDYAGSNDHYVSDIPNDVAEITLYNPDFGYCNLHDFEGYPICLWLWGPMCANDSEEIFQNGIYLAEEVMALLDGDPLYVQMDIVVPCSNNWKQELDSWLFEGAFVLVDENEFFAQYFSVNYPAVILFDRYLDPVIVYETQLDHYDIAENLAILVYDFSD